MKPKIAKIHFENNVRPILFDNEDEVPPYEYHDEDDRIINKFEAYHDYTNVQHNHDCHHYGDIITGDEMEHNEPVEPFINILKNTGIINKPKQWKPGLDPIKEERKTE